MRRRQAASPSWMRSVISISGGFGAVLGGVAGVSFRQLAGRMEMSIAEADYLEKNRSSWQYGYDAPNVESWVFRWNGRILRNKLGITSGNLLDWGCGQGATAGFFQRIGFDAYGVDIAAGDLERAKRLIPSERLKLIFPKPDMIPFFNVSFDVVVSIQSFYFLSDTDMAIAIASLHAQMKPGAILYATMIALDSQFGKISTDGPDGMRRLVKSNERYDTDSFLNFVTDEADLVSKFPGFEPVLIGYYDADWGEGSEKHWHITARRV
jgi:SAM-dependent methyltransferase